MIAWPRPIYRGSRDADPVARACPVEAFPARRRRSRWLVTVAAVGLVAIAAIQLTRPGA